MNKPIPLYQALARIIVAIRNCEKSGNAEWRERHANRAQWLVKRYMPSGSGIDCGTAFHIGSQVIGLLVFDVSFHHMGEHGDYREWTEHQIIVRPSLSDGIALRVTGKDRNDIKSYLAEIYDHALCQLVNEYGDDLEEREGRANT